MIRAITLAACLLLLGSAAANAVITCTITGSTVAFGVFTRFQVTTVSQLTIRCTGTGNANYTLALSTGSSGTYSSRQMRNGVNTLFYNLYQDAAFTQIWGNGTGGSTIASGKLTGSGGTKTFVLSVYGKIPVQTTPAGGNYSDTIIATLNYGGVITTTSFLVTGTVQVSCTISANNLSFGSYTGSRLDAQSQISLNCSNTAPWTVGLNQGTFPGATVTTRRMTGPSNAPLSYSLFRDAARTLNWGNTAGIDTISGTGTGNTQTLTVYGRLPASQSLGASGGYQDTIIATLTF